MLGLGHGGILFFCLLVSTVSDICGTSGFWPQAGGVHVGLVGCYTAHNNS